MDTLGPLMHKGITMSPMERESLAEYYATLLDREADYSSVDHAMRERQWAVVNNCPTLALLWLARFHDAEAGVYHEQNRLRARRQAMKRQKTFDDRLESWQVTGAVELPVYWFPAY